MANKKADNKPEFEEEKQGTPTGDEAVQQMLGHHRDENPAERKPETYHFSRQELEHKRDRVWTEGK